MEATYIAVNSTTGDVSAPRRTKPPRHNPAMETNKYTHKKAMLSQR